MTRRQMQAWLYWEREDLNDPGKTEQYLMYLIGVVSNLFSAGKGGLRLDDYRIEFGYGPGGRPPALPAAGGGEAPKRFDPRFTTDPNKIAMAKSVFLARMTGDVRVVETDRDGNVLGERVFSRAGRGEG